MLSKLTKKTSSFIVPSVASSFSKVPMYRYSNIQSKDTLRDNQLGISTYMKNIYGTSLLSFGGLLVGASVMSPYVPPGPALLGGLIFSLGGIIGFQMS